MDKDTKRQKLMSEIKIRVKELNKLGFYLSDCSSTIVLFDNKMFGDKSFDDLTDAEQNKTMVDSL